MKIFLIALISYVLGSIPFGYVISKLKGLDITKFGSGNIGATNVGRFLGKRYFFLVLFLDALKGFVPTFLFNKIFGLNDAMIAGFFSILGHTFSVFMKFKGGKGVATSLGVSFAIIPFESIIGIVIWLVFLYITKTVSIASIISAVSVFFVVMFSQSNLILKIVVFVIALIIVFRHKSNIVRFLKGQEPKFYFFK
jgi:glycerol-3-phosphate acyltransferase PlsY